MPYNGAKDIHLPQKEIDIGLGERKIFHFETNYTPAP